MPFRYTVAVDLDGTLAEFDGWVGPEHIGDPLPDAAWGMHRLRDSGWHIVIFTTRAEIDTVSAWLIGHGIPFDGINSTEHNPPGTSEKPIASVYIDDRAYPYCGQNFPGWRQIIRDLSARGILQRGAKI